MSKRSETIAAEECIALGASQPQFDAYPNREVNLGALAVVRALPIKDRRLVGPWCFLDRFGPLTFSNGKPMDVAPHPHIGPSRHPTHQSRSLPHDQRTILAICRRKSFAPPDAG